MPIPYYLHDFEAKREYQIEWKDWLRERTLSGSEWLPATATVVVADDPPATFTTTLTSAYLSLSSAAVDGEVYHITNRVTTTDGRTEDQTIALVAGNR